MKKRILSVLLTVVLVVSAVVISTTAANYDGEKTPAIVYGDTYPAQTIPVTQISGFSLTSGIKVAEVGADYIKFENIDTTNVVQLKGSTIEYAKVTGGVAGTYSSTGAITGTTVTEYTLSGLEEGATYSIRAISGRLSRVDGTNTLRNLVASDPIEVTLVSYTDAGKWPTPTGLSTDAGKLIGTEAGKTYQYVKLSAPEFAIDEAGYVDYNATSTTLAAGLYAVRIKEGTEGTNKYQTSDSAIVLVKGANVGTATFLTTKTPAEYTGDYVTGKWTFLSTHASGGSNLAELNSSLLRFNHNVSYAFQERYVEGYYAYQFNEDEIIAVSDFLSFGLWHNNQSGSHLKGAETAKGVVIFYVFGGTQDTYKVPFEWYTAKEKSTTITIDLASVAGSDAKGYIYRIDIDIVDASAPENASLELAAETDLYQHEGKGAYYSYQLWRFLDAKEGRIKFNARVPEETPVISAEGTDTDGVYRIIGLNPAKNYAFSNDGVTYNDLPAGSTYVDVSSTGKYYVYAKATATTYDSEIATITISGAMPAIPEGTIYYEDGYIKGLDAEANKTATGIQTVITYDWCRVAIDGELLWNKTATSDDGSIQIGPGYYAIRYASRTAQNLVAGATTYIFVYEGGSKKGTVSTAVPASEENSNGFVQGAWTMSATEYNTYKSYNEGTNRRLACAYLPRIEDITDLAWQYQFADDEIFPLAELGTLSFQIGFQSTGSPFANTHLGKVRLYIADGDADYYDVPFAIPEYEMSTIDVASIWEDEVELDSNFTPKGYVTALQIFYYTEETVGGVTCNYTSTSNDYAVAIIGGHDVTTMRSESFVGLKTKPEVDSIQAVPAVGTYGGELIGLNPEVVYQYAEYTEGQEPTNWQYSVGKAYINLPAGTYAIRAYAPATDTKYLTTDNVIRTIDPAPAGDQRESAKVDKLILPDEVELSDANYVFDIEESRWINRIAISNIIIEAPNATITFEAKDYKLTIAASDIDLSLEPAHYFDMMVTFDGESAYDRMYPKMKALADEKELVCGVHFESTTPYFFEKATFELFLGEEYDGYDVELRSYNERVNRLRNEETVTVDGGWATFSTFGEDYLVLCPAMAEEE